MTSEHLDLVRQQMEAELAGLTGLLEDAGESQGFLGQLLRSQAQDRVSAIGVELEGLNSESFELTFAEKGALYRHSLSTSVLSNLLSRFQKAVTYAGWARLAGPGVFGDPPALVARAFETEVNAFKPGSFAVELAPYEDALEHTDLVGTLSDFLMLAGAGVSEDRPRPPEDVIELAQSLGSEATKRFGHFFAKLHEAHLEVRFEWLSRPEEAVALQPDQALALSKWLKDVDEEFDTVTVSGTLTAADANEGRFAITDDLGEIHDGKAAPELLSHVVIDNRYAATMRVTTYTSKLTGNVNQRAVLETLTPAS